MQRLCVTPSPMRKVCVRVLLCVCVCVCVCVCEGRKCEPQVSLFYVQPQQVLKKIELVAAGSKHGEANLAAGSIS